ncbi:MAG: hypothetical protein HC820_03510 [Hydrococcus sp. RM1_1_31]|nr:hypothetical protein [Hydrococcus sp. RM1_1_31]
MTQTENSQELTEWKPYNLDYYAQKLVLKHRDKKNVLNESHKMRMAVAYGLERFWGEHLRLKYDKKEENQNKSKYWKDVWNQLAIILSRAGVKLHNDEINSRNETQNIQDMAQKLWSMPLDEQRVALMVLTQFCDALVWWTQRYKKKDS